MKWELPGKPQSLIQPKLTPNIFVGDTFATRQTRARLVYSRRRFCRNLFFLNWDHPLRTSHHFKQMNHGC